MTLELLMKVGGRTGAALVMFLLLNGSPDPLVAQTAPPPGEPPRQEEQTVRESAPPSDTATDKQQPPQGQGGTYRNQKDNLKPFEPSEEIRVDKAVDFPADI